MSTNLQPGFPSKKPTSLNTGLLISVSGQVGLAIIGIIIVSLIVGLGIDELLQAEKHPFTILLFLGSVPFSLVATYWLARRATRELSSHQPADTQSAPGEEEDKRE